MINKLLLFLLLFTALIFKQFIGSSYGQDFSPVDITTDKLTATGKGTPDTSSQYPPPESFPPVDITTDKLTATGKGIPTSIQPPPVFRSNPTSPPMKK